MNFEVDFSQAMILGKTETEYAEYDDGRGQQLFLQEGGTAQAPASVVYAEIRETGGQYAANQITPDISGDYDSAPAQSDAQIYLRGSMGENTGPADANIRSPVQGSDGHNPVHFPLLGDLQGGYFTGQHFQVRQRVLHGGPFC